MIPTSLVLDLISAFKKNDDSSVDENIKKIIYIAEKKGQVQLLQKLKKIYADNSSDKTSNSTFRMQNLTNQNSNLFEKRISNVTLKDIVLSKQNELIFHEFLNSYQKRAIFKEHGIESENKILLYGPPGTGKTLFTYILAGELGLPVLHVSLDNLISSYLGETGKNIRNIFDVALRENCILFIDEFDSVAKKRDDIQELGELKRVVTVLLQNIDSLSNDNILIAATNHEHLLDSAIWRRFDYQLNIDLLDEESTERLLKMYLAGNDEAIDFSVLTTISNGLSGSLIKQLINKGLRAHILNNKIGNINSYLIESLLIGSNFANMDLKVIDNKNKMKDIISKLRMFDSKTYTYKRLEDITKIPHSTLNYYLNS